MRLLKSFFVFCMVLICMISLGACGKAAAANSANQNNNSSGNNQNNNNENNQNGNNDDEDPDDNGNDEDEETEQNQDNNNEDPEPVKTITAIKVSDEYYQTLYNIGEVYANDIKLSVTYENEKSIAETEIVNAVASMLSGFPTQTEGAAEIAIRLDEHETKVKLFFTDFDKKGIIPKTNVSPFQETLSFPELIAEYTFFDAENNNCKYSKKLSISDYKYLIDGTDYQNGESPDIGLHKNVSIYTYINSKKVTLSDPFDLIIGKIAETVTIDLNKIFPESDSGFHKNIECHTLFYMFLNHAYGDNNIPLTESDIWKDIHEDKILYSFEDLLPYDTENALGKNWPSKSYASDLVNGKVSLFKETIAKTYKKLLRETSPNSTIHVCLITAPITADENSDKDRFILIFDLTPGNFFQYILNVDIE